MDPFALGIFITIGAAVVGMFIRIEHRLTKVETTIEYIKDNISGCQQPLDKNT